MNINLDLFKKTFIVISLVFLLHVNGICASGLPFIGAQVFIEPGQTDEYVENLFSTMKENGMTVCRIRMFESYMRKSDGVWDFTLFDRAFDSAYRNRVKIYCTFFPETDKLDIGGWKFPYDDEQWISFKDFIRNLTEHYREHPALAGWVLINEPGIGGGNYPNSPFMERERSKWNSANPEKEFTDKGYPILMNTRDQQFVNVVTTKFLNEIANEVRKYDNSHELHVNPAGVFSNYGDYDFPVWRKFLTSLGGSAHPSWHFGDFKRSEYTLAMMTLSEMLRSGAGELPWFMTEIQGGNNTYSGNHAFCPTENEITQWLWTIIGCEAKGGIFWMLNPRASGIEAGEWGMLTYQNKPSIRMKAAKQFSDIINKYSDIFSEMREISSGIDVIYLKESLWAENRLALSNDVYEGRCHGAVFKSSASCFRSLSERGLNVGLKEINEYDFTKNDYLGKTIVLSNQIALPPRYLSHLKCFVKNGGTLIVEGLTGYFDDNLHAQVVTGSPFYELFGDRISEFILRSKLFHINYSGIELPSHLWNGTFANNTSDVLETEYGRGKVVWIPSNIALGARVKDDYEALSDFLFKKSGFDKTSIRFDKYYRGILLRTLDTEKGRLLICTSNSEVDENPILYGLDNTIVKVLYASEGCSTDGSKIIIQSGGVLVLLIED